MPKTSASINFHLDSPHTTEIPSLKVHVIDANLHSNPFCNLKINDDVNIFVHNLATAAALVAAVHKLYNEVSALTGADPAESGLWPVSQ